MIHNIIEILAVLAVGFAGGFICGMIYLDIWSMRHRKE